MFAASEGRRWLRLATILGAAVLLLQPSIRGQSLSKLVVESGALQTGPPGGFAPLPLIATLKNPDGSVPDNQPVRFETKEGQMQESSLAAPSGSLVVQTDKNGQATVFYRLPDAPNKSCLVVATTGQGEPSQTVRFRIASDDGSGKYPSPFETPIHIEFNADASSTITWTNRLAGAAGFCILRSDDKGQTWKNIGTVPRECRKCTVPPGMIQGVIGRSVFKVEPMVEGAEAQLVPTNTPAPENDPVLMRERKFRESLQRRGLPTPALTVTF